MLYTEVEEGAQKINFRLDKKDSKQANLIVHKKTAEMCKRPRSNEEQTHSTCK